MPQPMSTPTAFGITELSVGKTQPIVTPKPTWQSGMTATACPTSGCAAALRSCCMAAGSISAGVSQVRIGAASTDSRISYILLAVSSIMSTSVTWLEAPDCSLPVPRISASRQLARLPYDSGYDLNVNPGATMAASFPTSADVVVIG